jgi:Leucine-rich repeat (LRR) protein
LKYLKNLKYLDVGHNAIDDLSFLYDLPELRILIVADNYVTDYITDLTPIASLKHLQYLEVFTNNITDLSPLSGRHPRIAGFKHLL